MREHPTCLEGAKPSVAPLGLAESRSSGIRRLTPRAADRRSFGAGDTRRPGRILVHVVLLLSAVAMLFPFFFMVATACKDEAAFGRPGLLPATWHWRNFPDAWMYSEQPQGHLPWYRRGLTPNLLVSAGVAVVTTLLTILISAMAGYAFAKHRFRGSRWWFAAVLATLMVPGQVTMVPNFVTITRLGLYDTWLALILPAMPLAFGVFLMRQFFLGVPDSLLEAARIDGAGEWRTFVQVALPLCRPAMATLGIFTFMASWNSFLWPLVVLDSPGRFTLPIALLRFMEQYVTKENYLMAVSALTVLPIALLFICFQRAFLAGVATTGLKE